MKNRRIRKMVPIKTFYLFKEIQQTFESYEKPFAAPYENDDVKQKNDSDKNGFDGGIKI